MLRSQLLANVYLSARHGKRSDGDDRRVRCECVTPFATTKIYAPSEVEPYKIESLAQKTNIEFMNDQVTVPWRPLTTPRRLPDCVDKLPAQPFFVDEQKKVSSFLAATPTPSQWPVQCAIAQTNSNSPIEDRYIRHTHR